MKSASEATVSRVAFFLVRMTHLPLFYNSAAHHYQFKKVIPRFLFDLIRVVPGGSSRTPLGPRFFGQKTLHTFRCCVATHNGVSSVRRPPALQNPTENRLHAAAAFIMRSGRGIFVDTSQYITKSLSVSCRFIKDFSYIYREDTRELFQLNETGSAIWEQLNGKTTIADIITHCLNEFDGEEAEIANSVLDFVNLLIQEHTVELSSQPFYGVMHVA